MSGNKKPRKAYKPKYAYLPSGISALPIAHGDNPSTKVNTDKAIARMVTLQTPPTKWDSSDFNRMVLLLNTAKGLSNRFPDYRSESMTAAQEGLKRNLEYIRQVKSLDGCYGSTMGLWFELKECAFAMISFFDTVPLVRMLRAEQSAFAHIDSAGNYEYRL